MSPQCWATPALATSQAQYVLTGFFSAWECRLQPGSQALALLVFQLRALAKSLPTLCLSRLYALGGEVHATASMPSPSTCYNVASPEGHHCSSLHSARQRCGQRELREIGRKPSFSLRTCTHMPFRWCRCLLSTTFAASRALVHGTSWSAVARLATRCSCCACRPLRQPSQAPLASLRRHSLLLSWTQRARAKGSQVRPYTPT